MTGFEIASLIKIGGDVLGSLAQKTPKQQRTWQDSWYGTLIKKGAANAKRVKAVQSMASAITRRPESDFTLGVSDYYRKKNDVLYDESLKYGYGTALDYTSGKTPSPTGTTPTSNMYGGKSDTDDTGNTTYTRSDTQTNLGRNTPSGVGALTEPPNMYKADVTGTKAAIKVSGMGKEYVVNVPTGKDLNINKTYTAEEYEMMKNGRYWI